MLLAQANYIGAQFVDLTFYFDTNTIGITPVMKDDVMKRFQEGTDGTSMEDIINYEL